MAAAIPYDIPDKPLDAAVSVDVRPVEGRKELREFIELPYRLHSTSQYWIPPLRIKRGYSSAAARTPSSSTATRSCSARGATGA